MKARNYPDAALGLAFAAGGAVILTNALNIRSMPGLPVGPGLFPSITGAAMIVFGLLLAAQSWLTKPKPETPLIPKEHTGGAAKFYSSGGFLSPFVLGILAAIVASIVLMPVLGFLVTGMLFVFVVVLLSGGKVLAALVFSPVAATTIYALFAFGFRVPLPRGVIG